jgi:FkbM family methyltransferase
MKPNSLAVPFRRTTLPKSFSARMTLPAIRLVGALTRRNNYRGVGRAARMLGAFLPPASAQIQLSASTTLEIDLFDDYWIRLIFDDFIYEPEIEAFLACFIGGDFAWLDCGANIGYWSLRLSEQLPPRRVVAVEASPSTYAKLDINNRLSGNRFQTINRALSDSVGNILPFVVSVGHAAAHLAASDEALREGGGTIDVETTTIDEVLKSAPVDLAGIPLLIKLDVEGAEIAAMRGADATIKTHDTIIIYECHGKERDCSVTSHLLQDGRFDLYSLEGGLKKISSVEEALALKKDLRKGYNFAAVKRTVALLRASDT